MFFPCLIDNPANGSACRNARGLKPQAISMVCWITISFEEISSSESEVLAWIRQQVAGACRNSVCTVRYYPERLAC
jgi:hypothetical protein